MDFLEKIIKIFISFFTNPMRIIILLIGIIFLQFLFGLFYTRSLRNNPTLSEADEQFQDDYEFFSNKKLTFTQAQIAFFLKGLNIPTDELYQHYKPQIDSMKKIITGKEKELDHLKAQIRNNPDSDKISQLNQQISFAEQQITFYKTEASYWEKRSIGLRNLVKTLGLDSIMVYLPHQESINQNLAELSPPQVIMKQRNKKMAGPKTEPQETNTTSIIEKNPLTTTSFASEKSVLNEKKTEQSISLPVMIQNQATAISQRELRVMLKKYNFFDYYWNQNGEGFSNKFELQIVNGDTVVIDRASRLMWQQSGSLKGMSYENAEKWIEELNQGQFAGYRDWRLPTLKEAMTLVEPEKNDVLYIDGLFAKEQKLIWTSDLVDGESCNWMVSFSLGGCRSSYTLSLSNYYVRAVRSIETTSD
jgi:hypothetical protein